MVGVVQADPDHLPRAGRRCAELRVGERATASACPATSTGRRPVREFVPAGEHASRVGREASVARQFDVEDAVTVDEDEAAGSVGDAHGRSFGGGGCARRHESADRGVERVVGIGGGCADPGDVLIGADQHDPVPATGAKPCVSRVDVDERDRPGGPRQPPTPRGRRRAR